MAQCVTAEDLLVGLLRCGHCGRKLKVHHSTRQGPRYVCTSDIASLTNKTCIAFSNMRIDTAVSAEVLRAVAPLAIEAALQVIADREHADLEQLRQCELALEQARYEAMHARRHYDAVDPDNRLVAGELERRWNECLATVARLEDQMEKLRHDQPQMLSDDDRTTLLTLADDLPGVWNHPESSAEIRKRILRTVLKEIIVTIEGNRLHLVLHWQGGDQPDLKL